MKQQMIESMLEEKSPEQFLKIKNLLEACLSRLRSLIDTHLNNYVKLIVGVKRRTLDGDQALQHAEILQTELIHFFRKSALLFHPDKSFGNEGLRKIQTELFQLIQQLSEESLEKIKKDLQTLQGYLPKRRNTRGFWGEMRKTRMDVTIRKFKADLEAMGQQFKTDLEVLRQQLNGGTEAELLQFRAEAKVRLQKFNVETEVMHQQTHQKIDELEAENDQNSVLCIR